MQAAMVAVGESDAKLVGHDLKLTGDCALRQAQFGFRGGSRAEAVERLQRQKRGQRGQVPAGEHMRFPHRAAIWFR